MLRIKERKNLKNNFFIVQALFISNVNSETVNLESTDTCVIVGENRTNAQIFILHVWSKLLLHQDCRRISNMGVFVPFSMAIIRVLKKRV
jgi:hypothetical protein